MCEESLISDAVVCTRTQARETTRKRISLYLSFSLITAVYFYMQNRAQYHSLVSATIFEIPVTAPVMIQRFDLFVRVALWWMVLAALAQAGRPVSDCPADAAAEQALTARMGWHYHEFAEFIRHFGMEEQLKSVTRGKGTFIYVQLSPVCQQTPGRDDGKLAR